MRMRSVILTLVLLAITAFSRVVVDLAVRDDGRSCPCCKHCGCSPTILTINWLPMLWETIDRPLLVPETSGIVGIARGMHYAFKPLRFIFHPPNPAVV
jgi:hypothetical protein